MELRLRAPLEGEANSELEAGPDTPREAQHPELLRYVQDGVLPALDDLVAEAARLLDAGDDVERIVRGPLVRIRDLLIDALDAPGAAYSLDRGKEEASSVEQLVAATSCVFAIEEFVDSVLLIVMAKNGVNALRVKPAFNLRTALLLGCAIAAVFGWLLVADQVTWEGDEEERRAFAGNSTQASDSDNLSM